ncbi:hypothetical protein BB559_002747 [Furculomyces boomerangus]|uniref:Rhodanese domain-containing protein n=2 Tax=Harpellales TaxID=61421 RepID=A0A2T9YSV3_9FUNG|nr:hypothetical protein BB559_002747 [Furculomyces boomerangus]PVZ97333.1 hypothetical protein BB558_006694 [Smittium angustum]PVZ99177.1 hypothetical protein BB558_004815 [Smittium angustum]
MADPKHSQQVTFEEVESLVENNLPNTVLVDVRTPEQHANGSIPGSVNLEFAEFETAMKLSNEEFKKKYGFSLPEKNGEEKLVLYCGGGTRCKKSAVIAEEAGYQENIFIYGKGYTEYKQKKI